METDDKIRQKVRERREEAEKSSNDRAAQLAYSGVVIYGVSLRDDEIGTLISSIQYANNFTLEGKARQRANTLLEMLKGTK